MKYLRITVDQVQDGTGERGVSCFVAESNDNAPTWPKLKASKEDETDWWGSESAFETTTTEFRKLTGRNASEGMVLIQRVPKEGKAGEYINFTKQAKRLVVASTDLWGDK